MDLCPYSLTERERESETEGGCEMFNGTNRSERKRAAHRLIFSRLKQLAYYMYKNIYKYRFFFSVEFVTLLSKFENFVQVL